MTYSSYPTTSHKYAYFWAKYRPALLKLMIASADGPQQYKFSSHEIKSADAKQKGHTFVLRMHKGKAVNNVRDCQIANDLLWILQQSGKAVGLSDTITFEFKLDRHFALHVARETEAEKMITDPVLLETTES
jgi:hypothetical protein